MQKRDFINSTFSLKSLMFYITLILISFIVSLKDPLAGILFLNSSLALFLIILVYKAFSFKLFFALALFIGVFWIYHSIYPILFLLDIPRAVDIPFVSYQTVFKSTLLVLITMIGILISILLITKFVKCHKRFKQINSYKANNTLIVISAIVLFILGFYIYFLGFKSSGYSLKDIFTYYGSSYIRLNLTNMPDYYRLLMYASSVLISSTLFNKKNEKSNNYLIVFFYILVFLYSFFQFGIGNRREVLIILLPFLGIIFKNYFQRFSFRTFFFMLLLLLISFFIFQYFVVVRSGFNLDNFSTKEFIQFSFSSFDGNAPFATICFYVENGVPKYQYGLTYIYNPLYNIIGYFISAERLIKGGQITQPSSFLKRSIFEEIKFNTKYNIASDYDFFLRCNLKNYKFKHIPFYIVKMRVGGTSNGSLLKSYKANLENFQILKDNNIIFPKMSYFTYRFYSRLKQLINKGVNI